MTQLFAINDVTLKRGEQVILDGLRMEVNQGDFVTIIGPSGSGKSTFLRLLNCLSSPHEGKILYLGIPIEDYEVTNLRRQVSYVFQKPYLFGETVKDNLIYPFEVNKEEAAYDKIYKLLDRMNLNKDIINKPKNQLSGGEQQRICLIRSILSNPRVLLLDEITASLDPVNTKIVEEFIREIAKENNLTVLFVTHNIAQAQELGQKTLYLKDGKVKYFEDTEYLFNNISDEELNKFKAGQR